VHTLLGFATIEHPSGIVVSDVGLFRDGDSVWANPPGKPKIDREGRVIRKADNRFDYTKLIWPADKHTQLRWWQAVIAAVREDFPDALEEIL
jgi:hypothetical protein